MIIDYAYLNWLPLALPYANEARNMVITSRNSKSLENTQGQ